MTDPVTSAKPEPDSDPSVTLSHSEPVLSVTAHYSAPVVMSDPVNITDHTSETDHLMSSDQSVTAHHSTSYLVNKPDHASERENFVFSNFDQDGM